VIKTFCDRCESEMTGESGMLMVLVKQVITADKDAGPQPQAEAQPTRLGLVCRPCSVLLTQEAIRILTTKVAGAEAG
jgi:hypothetical protein